MKVKNDHRSKFFNLSNWKKPEKIRVPPGFELVTSAKYRYDALPTELSSHTLGAPNGWLHSGGHGFESCWSPVFVRLLLSNCLNWKIYCDDQSSLIYFIYFFVLRKLIPNIMIPGSLPLFSHALGKNRVKQAKHQTILMEKDTKNWKISLLYKRLL